MEKVFIKDKQGNKVLPITHVSAVLDDEGNDLGSHLGNFEDEVRGLVDTPHQEYVTVATYASLPASGSEDTIYRVSNYDGSQSQVAADVYSEYAWDGTQYVFLCVKSQVGEVFDISAYHNNATYVDLNAALTGNTGGVPSSLQKGGMSVKFVQSYDNKYVMYLCNSGSFTIDTSYWEKINLEEEFNNTFPRNGVPTELNIRDTDGYAVLRLLSSLYVDDNGNIKTKGFESDEVNITNVNTDEISITDKDGNAIVKIDKNGVLKTKSFDSSSVGKFPFIVVDINGKGDYTSLEDAINAAGDSYLQDIDRTIIVMPGTYHMTQMATDATQLSFGNRSLNIIGVDREKCIIYGDNGYYTNSSQEGSPGFRDTAPLKLAGNCYVANLTIISTDDNFQMDPEDTGDPTKKHHAYCIHIDYYNQGRWTFHLDNCILKNDHYACIGVGLRGKLVVTNCIMECAMYDPDPLYVRGCVYAHDSGQAGVPGPYDEVEVLVKDCILTGKSGAPLTFYTNLDKTMYLTFINNVVFNEQGGSVLVMGEGHQGGHLYKTKYCFGNNNNEINY